MLNPFPIQFLALFAHFLLRIVVGFIFFYLGAKHFRYRHELKHTFSTPLFPLGSFAAVLFALSELTLSLLFVIGAYTQYAALVALFISVQMILFRHYFAHHTIPPRIFYVLLFGVSLSLFITGAGALAYDLPI